MAEEWLEGMLSGTEHVVSPASQAVRPGISPSFLFRTNDGIRLESLRLSRVQRLPERPPLLPEILDDPARLLVTDFH